jgi:NADH-quinone oxidoreductase subunit L
MFLALGVGAWTAAIFHFMTHAFFKALLFLAAGVVITAMHEEHDIWKMGGLRRKLPVAFWTFLIGSASLAALPLVTAGFYSKDLILWRAWSGPGGSPWLWAAAWVGALLTGVYIFRAAFVVFFGNATTAVTRRPGWRSTLPLLVLALLSIAGGWIELPPFLSHLFGEVTLFTGFVDRALPATPTTHGAALEPLLEWLAVAASLGGIFVAWLLFLRYPQTLQRLVHGPVVQRLRAFWHAGWGFDALYDRVFVRPYVSVAHADRDDAVDRVYNGVAALAMYCWRLLSASQDGRLRRDAAAIAAGAVIAAAIVIFM